MLVKATKKLAKILNDNIKDYTITLETLTEKQYSFYVDIDTFYHTNDYNIKTNKFNVIVIQYPNEFYAVNRYITTNDLNRIFNACNKTLEDFILKFKNEIEI